MQIFQHHCVGGFLGNVLTALFAQASVAGFDGVLFIKGGFLDHNYAQIGYQLVDSIVAMLYAFFATVGFPVCNRIFLY
jgi:Amt family ammonium transporter